MPTRLRTRPMPSRSVGAMSFDVERARRETPGTAHVVHLNNASAALPPTVVTGAVIDHLRHEAQIGDDEAAGAAGEAIEATYASIAGLIGCRSDEIAVVENATRAWDMAFYALQFSAGDRILTSRAEYASNVIALLQVARRSAPAIEVVEDDENGQISVADL